MALEAIKNTTYHDAAITTEKPKVETGSGTVNSAAMNIVELPSNSQVAGKSVNKEKGNVQMDAQISDQQIKDTVTQVNNKLKMHRTKCEFSYHEETKRVSIKVMDKETDEIIREIPPEQTLEMIQKAWELAGFLIDEKR